MTDHKDLPPDFADLRRRAEELIAAEAVPPEELSPDQAARLIHELRVHQIELEMQNDELRRSQAELEESRSKYADLYDFAPVGYLTLDPRGAIVEANLTAATLLGVERSRLLGRFFPHLLVEADRRVFRQLMGNGLNLPERRGEVHLKDGHGDVRVMLLDILFLTDAEGQDRRRVSLTDITELKRTQEELRLHKEDLEELVAHRTTQLIEVNEELRRANGNLEALFAAAPLAIAEFDAEGRVTKINPAAERLYGWSQEEVQGRLPLAIPRESPEESLALLQRVLGGESVTGVEITQQRQDGTLMVGSVSAAPLYDARGNMRGFVGLAEDITERKKLEEDVRTQAQVLASMGEGVAVTGPRGQIIYTNPAFDAMFGYNPGELTGRHSNILNHTPPEENSGLLKDILTAIKTSGIWTGEFHNCRKNGKPFFTLARISTLIIDGKKLYISVQEDITQRKKTQEMLARQAELLDLAHDAILVRDPKGRITYWNQGAARHYGYTKEEALGQISHKLLQTMFPQPLLEIERQLLEQGFWEGEHTHATRRGKNIVMNCRWTAKRDEAGRVVAILEINQNVTAQKQIEAEVHRLASFPLLNPTPILEVDQDGKVTYANPAARQLAEKLRFSGGMQAFLPPDLKEKFAAVGQGGPRQFSYDLSLKDRVYTALLSFPHDLPTARIYALDITERQRAEQARRESEERYRSLVELSPDAVLVHVGGKYVFANNAAARLFGAATPGEMQGQDVVGLIHPDFRDIVRARIQHAYQGGTTPLVEQKVLRLDGPPVDVEVLGTAITYGGQPAVLVVMRDITARQAAEAALRESQRQAAFLVELLEKSSQPFAIRRLDGSLEYFNPAYHNMVGYTKEELEAIHFIPDFTAPAWREREEALLQEILRSGEPLRYEKEYLHKDGRRVPAELFVHLRRDEGQPPVFYAFITDITERQQAEEALAESEERYRSLFENNHAVMLLIDPDTGAIMDANPAACAYYGYSREEFLDHRVTDLNTLDPEQVKEVMLQARDEARQHFEFKHRLADGVVRDVEVFSGPIRVKGRELLYSIVHDITARKEAEEALRESEAQFRSLFENMTEGVALHEVIYNDQGKATDYRIVATNPAFTIHTGLAAAEVQGRLASEAYGTGEPPYLEAFARVAYTGQPITFETFFPPLNRYFSISVTSPKPGHFVTVFEDITDRKEMEEALRRAHDELEHRVEKRTAALRRANKQLFQEIEERQRVEDRLRDSEARFTAFMEHLPGLAVMRDMEGRYLFANRAWEETMDLAPGVWQGKTLAQLWPPEQAAALAKSDFQIISTGEPTEEVEEQVLADGPHHFLTSRFPITDAGGLPYMVGAIAIDVTGRQRAEQQVAETGRLYRVLSQVNEAIMRGRDQQSLFDKVCSIVVEEGLFRLAWVGLTDPEGRAVRVASKYGFDQGYLDNLVIPVADVPESQGPTGTAIRENRYDVCNDLDGDPRMAPWRTQAMERGYYSSGAFPLRVGAAVVGAITLYAPRPEFFTAKEIELLTSLADNLSFALEFLDREAKRRQAEEALATERQRFLDLLENLPAFVYLQAPDYSLRFANREFRERFGEPEGGACYTLIWGKHEPCPECPTFTVFHTGQPKEWEWSAPDGRIYQVYDYPFADADGSPLVLEMGIDITQRKRAEEALAEQAMLIQDLYNNAPCGYHSLDSEGYYVQINDTELAWLGYNRDEVIGKLKFSDLITAEGLKTFQETFSQLKTRGWVKDLEYNFVRKDGSHFPVLLSATAIMDETGNFLMGRSSMFDITERQRAEALIIEQGRQLEAFFAHSLTPLVFLDRDFNFLRVNEAYARANQRQAQEFIGHNHFEFYPHDENEAIFAEVVRSKTSYQVQARPFEFPDHPEWGLTYWDWSLTPVLNQAGEVDFLVFSLRDVTRRVLTEQARNRFIEILEATPDFVGIADFYGHLQYLNRAGRAMVGVGEDEDVTGLKVLDLHPPEIGRRILKKGSPTAIKKGAWQAELALLHKDGHEIPVSQVILSHKDASGRVQFFSTVARDISDIKEAQASILRQTAILNGINRIFRETLTCETVADLGKTCLTMAESLTNSRYGFITELNPQGTLDALAFSDPGWELCRIFPDQDPAHLKHIRPVGLLGEA